VPAPRSSLLPALTGHNFHPRSRVMSKELGALEQYRRRRSLFRDGWKKKFAVVCRTVSTNERRTNCHRSVSKLDIKYKGVGPPPDWLLGKTNKITYASENPPPKKWRQLDGKHVTENTRRKTLDGMHLTENYWRKTLDGKHLTEFT